MGRNKQEILKVVDKKLSEVLSSLKLANNKKEILNTLEKQL